MEDFFIKNMIKLLVNKKIRETKKLLGQNEKFPTRLPNANEKIRKTYFSLTTKKFSTIDVMIIKIQSLKGKIKLKFHQDFSFFYGGSDERRQNGNFLFEEDAFSRNAQRTATIMHEGFLSMKFCTLRPKSETRTKYKLICIML